MSDMELNENEEHLEDDIIVLNDEEGNEVGFTFLDLIEYEENEYVVLLPVDNEDEVGEVVILKVEESDEPEMEAYVSVDDESVLEEVFKIFKERFKDEFDFVDE